MQYKIRYRPLERLGPGGWSRFEEEEQARAIQHFAPRREMPVAELEDAGGSFRK